MAEYRTQILDRECLLTEVDALVTSLGHLTVLQADVSFGWDSNQAINTMWQPRAVNLASIRRAIDEAESIGLVEIGKADIFVEVPDLLFTLCHEGDVHVGGASPLVAELAERWFSLGYEPYALLSEPNPTFQRTASPPLN